MTKLKLIFLTLFALASFTGVYAQPDVEMADIFRSNGKIYVVVAVCLTILLGLFWYVWRLDCKLKRLEKEKH